MKEKAVVVLSGGMDSTTLLYDIKSKGYDVYAISFNYKQRHSKELKCASATCSLLNIPHTVLPLNVLNTIAPSSLTRKSIKVEEGHYSSENMKSTVVPNRNMVLLSLATAYAIGIKAKHLYYGAHAGDHTIYPDCRPSFVKAMQKAINIADWHKVKLHAPYLHINKIGILRRGVKLGVDYGKTWTCYKGLSKACGVCGSCQERLEAFNVVGIKDPLKYEGLWWN